jgi:hypothetical protein
LGGADKCTQMSDVRTIPYHPQSEGLDEQVHRTMQEVPLEATLYQVHQVIESFGTTTMNTNRTQPCVTCGRWTTFVVTRGLARPSGRPS